MRDDQRRSRTTPGGWSRKLRCCSGQSGCRRQRRPGWDAGRALRVGRGGSVQATQACGPFTLLLPWVCQRGTAHREPISLALTRQGEGGQISAMSPHPRPEAPLSVPSECLSPVQMAGALESPGVLRIKTRYKQHFRKENVGRETRVGQTDPPREASEHLDTC